MNDVTLKEKTHLSEDERRIAESDLVYTDSMNIVSNVNLAGKSIVSPYRMDAIQMFVYDFTKTYLYGLYTGELKSDLLKINSFFGLASSANPTAVAPQITGFSNEGLAIIDNHNIIADVTYKNSRYHVSLFIVASGNGPFVSLKYFVSTLGIENSSVKTLELVGYLEAEAIRNSVYKNKSLNLVFEGEGKLDLKLVDNKNFENETFDNIFIPNPVKAELIKFHNCVDKFDTLNFGLRYMLCGEPGTGKTKSVRTLMNMCQGKATIIMAEGEIKFKAVFEFAKMLAPAIICFDDLDLLIGSRERHFDRQSLGEFLQELDGFEKNNIFLLCTTNDKELIDKAASRPGRFDLVLDYGKINKSNYMDIINANCKNESIINLFDKSLLDVLKKKKVTGAFIVNLLKQLEIKSALEPDSDMREYIDDLLKISYKGFYEVHKEEEEIFSFGFSNNGHDN